MLRNLIVLPDGTELFSGVGTVNAVQNTTITECVNAGTELTLGSVCSSMLKMKIITPGGGVNIAAGDEITLYKVDDGGNRAKVGLFTIEKPTRPSANTYGITAYDRVSWLDKDLSEWLNNLTGWPYMVYDFASMVCEACGLVLKNESLLNGDYQIRQFLGDGITGRRLMQWVGEICGRFCRATADGEIEFAWYEPSGITISPSGSVYFYRNSLTYEDYETAEIEKVQLRLTDDDVGAVWPEISGEANTYAVTGNYLLTADTTATLLPVAQNLYEALKGLRYTPCKVSIPANLNLHAGHTVQIEDRNGVVFSAYIMTKTQAGQRDTLECTGSPRRDSSTVVHNETLKALSGKMLEMKKTVEGLSVRASEVERKIIDTNSELADFEIQTTQKFSEVNMTSENIQAEVSRQTSILGGMEEQVAQATLTAEGVVLEIQKIRDDGVSKVTTGMGYTFDDEGIRVQKSGEEMENKLDNTGMYVARSGEPILRANNEGVLATDVTVRNFLNMGANSRFEDYDNGTDSKRTACFAM